MKLRAKPICRERSEIDARALVASAHDGLEQWVLSLCMMCATCLVAASLLAFHAPARVPARLNSLRAEFLVRASPEPHMAASDHDILLRVARGQQAERTPVWLMRQAGRYMADFRAYSDKYPFRMRSETPEIATELSLQPWRTFGVDGVIMFSDILTPLPALGIDFDVVKGSGPVIGTPLRSMDDVLGVKPLDDPDGDLPFIRTILGNLRAETEGKTTLLGFVGAPFTLVAYAVEGKANRHCIHSKQMMVQRPEVLHAALERLAVAVGRHACRHRVDLRRRAPLQLVALSRRRRSRGSSFRFRSASQVRVPPDRVRRAARPVLRVLGAPPRPRPVRHVRKAVRGRRDEVRARAPPGGARRLLRERRLKLPRATGAPSTTVIG